MIKFFRQSYAIQYVVIALLAIALWIPAFVSGKMVTGLESPVTPIFNVINGILDFSYPVQLIFAFLLLVLETLIFNTILVDNQIVGKVSTMGAFVFVLMMSLTCTQVSLYPFSLSVIFILLTISNIFKVYQIPNPEFNLVKAGAFVALASMCYFPNVILVLWIFVVLPIAKKGSLRLQLIPVFGFLFVYFAYFVFLFFFGDIQQVLVGYGDYFTLFQLSVEGFSLRVIILLSVLVVATAFLLLGGNNVNLEKAVAVRTKISITVVMAFFAVFLLFLGGNVLMNGLIFIVLSILVAYSFSYLGNPRWADLFLALFLVLVFADHYYFKLL